MLPWVLVAVLYVLGAVNMLPCAGDRKIRYIRVRWVILFWPVFVAWMVLGAVWEGWTLWRDRHEPI